MPTHHPRPSSRRAHLVSVTLALLGVLATACATEEPLAGSWNQPDAMTPLPESVPVPPGTMLNIDATWQIDETDGFTVDMDLETLGLTDVIQLEGTYIDDGSELELAFTGFAVDPASPNTTHVSEDGAQCIVLAGFVNTEVCFHDPQVTAYELAGETLSLTLEHDIAGGAGRTDFTLTRIE